MAGGNGPVLADSFWHAPLAPAAMALTAGIVADRFWSIPLEYSLLLSGVGLLAWLIVCATSRRSHEGLLYLALASAALGAAYHHWWRNVFPADDLYEILRSEGRTLPCQIKVRGYLEEDPVIHPVSARSPLSAIPPEQKTSAHFQALQLEAEDHWKPVSGRILVRLPGEVKSVRVDDEVELAGLLLSIPPPANPGERDWQSWHLDRGFRLRLDVTQSSGTYQRLDRKWTDTFWGRLAWIRSWGKDVLCQMLPSDPVVQGLAIALILGDDAPLGQEEWYAYKCTGVIHVLVISGQHLVLLAAACLWFLPRLGFRQRQSAVFVALFLVLYVCLTGIRPPSTRSAVTMCSFFAGWVFGRRFIPANTLALAWMVVMGINPTSIFDAGCQLSFLCIVVLYRIGRLWEQQQRAALDNQDPANLPRLIDQTRPWWKRGLRFLAVVVWQSYLLSFLLWLAVTPLVAFHFNLVPLVAILLGPPVSLLTSIALAGGFLVLILAAFPIGLSGLLAFPLRLSLGLCAALVNPIDHWPAWLDSFRWAIDNPLWRLVPFWRYIPNIPLWWIVVFYSGLLVFLTVPSLGRYGRQAVLSALVWICLGLLIPFLRLPSDELRCTFLAVGNGGCTVLETPDGRTILYDVGTMAGPEVVERRIAPYLWHRGIRRIDDVIVSHADLDHFNGLLELRKRFALGRVIQTPSFSEKELSAVGLISRTLAEFKIPVEIVTAGDVILVGNEVTLEVLHPPLDGPVGKENVRSLTLRVLHMNHRILLTGDLEGEGLRQVRQTQTPRIDILMAPHHGSKGLDTDGLMKWAGMPWVVISSQGKPRGRGDAPEAYLKAEHFLRTWDQGAVTVRSHSTGLIVETFLTQQRFTKPTRLQRTKARPL